MIEGLSKGEIRTLSPHNGANREIKISVVDGDNSSNF